MLRPAVLEFVQLLGRHHARVRYVQTDDLQPLDSGEDDVGGLRIPVDVCLCGGVDVPVDEERAAEDDDRLELVLERCVELQRQCKVGECREAEYDDFAGVLVCESNNVLGGRSRCGILCRLGERLVRASKPVVSVNEIGDALFGRPAQGGRAPPVDIDVRPAGLCAQEEGIARGDVGGHVAEDRRQRKDLDLRAVEGAQDGLRVVYAGVRVNQQLARHFGWVVVFG